MKKQMLTVVMTLGLVLLLASAALAKDVLVVNGTEFDLHAIALSSSDSDSWGNDLLGDTVLHPGEGLQVNLSGSPAGWDMAVVDPEGQQLEFKNLDFTNFDKVTIYSDGTAQFE